ncbi:hypothetical protein AAJP47_06035 [Psychrobacter sp. B38]|uniref:hypothetical protein n=1 Tax=Psychrobacter sp. B38 TaxID=3143538 RepID=UPI00320D5456
MSINIARSDYDKISAHFYCVNFRRHNRMGLTSFYDAMNQYLEEPRSIWYQYDC